MSYRIEKKFILNPRKYEMLVQHLCNLKAKKIYEKRTVFSTYYDNDYFASYRNSEEGVIPRKKMRIRSYNSYHHSSDSMFESKISSEVDRFKKVEKFKNSSDVQNFLSKGFFDKTYGFCKPTINVSYEREYYSFESCRITIDRKIRYWQHNSNKNKCEEPLNVVEFKSEVNDEINLNNNILFNPISRFSKYCRGMNKIYFNIKNF